MASSLFPTGESRHKLDGITFGTASAQDDQNLFSHIASLLSVEISSFLRNIS